MTRSPAHGISSLCRAGTGAFALLVLVFALDGSALAKGKTPLRQVVETEHVCRTGWWRVRDGADNFRPTDGAWRPSWQTRCRIKRVVRYP